MWNMSVDRMIIYNGSWICGCESVVWIHVAEDIYQLWGFCEHDDAHFGSVECGKFDSLSDC